MTQPQDAFAEPKAGVHNSSNSNERSRGRGDKGDRRKPSIDVSKLFEKLPPHAIEAEMSLLGSMLLDPETIGDVVQVLRSGDDFFKPAHGQIFDAIIELYDKESRLDGVVLLQLLIDRGILDAVGGENYLITLAECVPTASHADYYARLVRDKSLIRRLIGAAGDIVYEAYHSPDQANEILDAAERKIFHIAESLDVRGFSQLSDLLQDEVAWFTNTDEKRYGLLSGFESLDLLTGGLQPGELSILAARPSMGKTSLALNIAEQVARDEHSGQTTPVGFFSLEMNQRQLIHRLIGARAGVNIADLQRNNLNAEKLRKVVGACEWLNDAPIILDDTPALTLTQLRGKARRMKTKFDIRAIFIDYLQLLSVGYRVESRQVEVSEISRGLKALARELEVPVFCLAQLNRSPEQREGHVPRLSDLRESGSIEQDADVVMFLHREAYYHKEDPTWQENNPQRANVAELIISKQRNGPVGVAELVWDGATTRFKNPYHGATPGEYV